jgi:hypothetical protein
MRLNALCLIGSLAAFAFRYPTSTGSVGRGGIRSVGPSSCRHCSTRQPCPHGNFGQLIARAAGE